MMLSPLTRTFTTLSRPLIALESTIVSHGMPYPQNLHCAQSVESIIRDGGCDPMTIAVRNGEVKIGLNDAELNDLALSGSEGRATKVTTRELGYILSKTRDVGDGINKWGSTTVASTSYLASQNKIDVFVTGGSGGVHRDYLDTGDVSSDLVELGRTNITVVSAGIKSILDIPRSLEYLETEGVTVGVYGSDEFPSFFSTTSGCKAPLTFDTIEQIAHTIINNKRLKMNSGMLLAVPNPKPLRGIEDAIQLALSELDARGITGKYVTPYLLKRVSEVTEGASLESNVALVENNAKVGAEGKSPFSFVVSAWLRGREEG
jgi:pseudouridine-5'-phosphate glycosidase